MAEIVNEMSEQLNMVDLIEHPELTPDKQDMLDTLLKVYHEKGEDGFRKVTGLHEDEMGDDPLESFPDTPEEQKIWIHNFLETLSWKLPETHQEEGIDTETHHDDSEPLSEQLNSKFTPFPLPKEEDGATALSSVVVPDGHTGCAVTEIGLGTDYNLYTSGKFDPRVSMKKVRDYFYSQDHSLYHKWWTFHKQYGLHGWERKLWKEFKQPLWAIFKTVNRKNPKVMPALLKHMDEPEDSPLWDDIVEV